MASSEGVTIPVNVTLDPEMLRRMGDAMDAIAQGFETLARSARGNALTLRHLAEKASPEEAEVAPELERIADAKARRES